MAAVNLLIIDYSLFMRATIKVLLWEKGVNILEADNQTKAVTIAVNTRPSLILMSMQFAKQNRMKFIRTLKNLHRCPVIIYGDIITRSDVISGFTASVDDILLNPLQQKERLALYFNYSPSQVRRKQTGIPVTKVEFKTRKPGPASGSVPLRTGGVMPWEREGVN